MNFVLIRHAKSLVNPTIPIQTWGLSADGVALAQRLRRIPPVAAAEVMYCSLQSKALETAVLATKDTGCFVRTEARLDEITSFTKQFDPYNVYQNNMRDFNEGRIARINGGETAAEAILRFSAALEDIAAAEAGKKTVAIVSHGNILSHYCAQISGLNPQRLLDAMDQPSIAILDWKNKRLQDHDGQIFRGLSDPATTLIMDEGSGLSSWLS